MLNARTEWLGDALICAFSALPSCAKQVSLVGGVAPNLAAKVVVGCSAGALVVSRCECMHWVEKGQHRGQGAPSSVVLYDLEEQSSAL